MMSVNVLVLGAGGVVGFGVCDAWLRAGATVYAVDNRSDALTGLEKKLGVEGAKLHTIVGDLSSDESGVAVKAAVLAALGEKILHHVVTALGCSTPAPSDTGVSASDALARVKESFEKVLYPNLVATTLFLDLVRNTEGASFTCAGGPFTHHCPNPELYPVSIVSGTINHFGTILNANTKDSKCRGNTLCCHYAIGYPGETESSFGQLLDTDFGPISDCRDWGKAFVRVANGTERLGFICMHDADETKVLVESKEWVWFPDQHKYGPKKRLRSEDE